MGVGVIGTQEKSKRGINRRKVNNFRIAIPKKGVVDFIFIVR